MGGKGRRWFSPRRGRPYDAPVTRFARHFFVCVNARPEGGKPACGSRGGAEVCAALEQAVAARPDLWGKVAVTGTACLGPCWDGPNAVVYPEGVWYAGLAAGDAGELADRQLGRGEVVERLRHRWPDDDE
jgi:(2Fe-2S) ferredoxin